MPGDSARARIIVFRARAARRSPSMSTAAQRLIAFPVEILVRDDALAAELALSTSENDKSFWLTTGRSPRRADATGRRDDGRAHGSRSSLFGLKRCPSWGAYGPAMR